MPTTYIQRTPSTTGTPTIFTYSVWFKRGNLGAYSLIGGAKTSDSSNYKCGLYFNGDDRIQFEQYGTGLHFNYQTWRQFKDTTAWYHLVVRYDSTDGTGGDRIKMYINGVEVTDWKTETDPGSSQVCYIGSTQDFFTDIGNSVDSGYFDGEMSHVNFIDGTAYDASTFGSTNATDGMWEINTAPSVTYGTNGFFLKMEDSSNLDLDSGTNTLTFTTSGTLTATKDNPSNNFCTLNPGKRSNDGTSTFSNGNTIFSNTGGTGWHQSGGTISATKGKYYYEVDITHTPGSLNTQFGWGAVDMQQITLDLNQPLGKLDVSGGSIVNYAPSSAFYDQGAYLYSTISSQDNQVNSSFAAATSGSVIMIAIDLDNGKFYVGKDGTWDTTSSSDPNAGTGGYSFTPGGFNFTPVFAAYGGNTMTVNFGNGHFGATAIGSPVSAGEGLWKYTPPTGYGAFCTKNINAA